MHRDESRLGLAQGGLRLMLGIVFLAHGAQKLFGWFGGGGINGTGEFMASLGLNPGVPLGILSGTGELVGGLLLLFGVWVPVAAVLLTIDMLVAIIFRTSKLGFISGGGVELNLLILAMVAALVLLGPGVYSLEQTVLRKRESRTADVTAAASQAQSTSNPEAAV
ncbi:MAG TPA: DoxX family protein [Chloroflexota bacterium]|nr:DoxX family protein [Chloroflexota bacterium]